MYYIVRMYRDGHPEQIVKKYMTLEEAQTWCNDPETSSSTATSAMAQRRTAQYGPWFDGYEEM